MNEVPEADRIKSLRNGEPIPMNGVSKLGNEPRPIRKKAFFRALNRGELWAIVPYEHMKNGGTCLTVGPNRFAKIIPDSNCTSNQAYIMWPLNEC